MEVAVKERVKQALDELPEAEAREVLHYITYLLWRREEVDQSWFESQEWQNRYREAKADLVAGRYQEFDDVEELLAELKS